MEPSTEGREGEVFLQSRYLELGADRPSDSIRVSDRNTHRVLSTSHL